MKSIVKPKEKKKRKKKAKANPSRHARVRIEERADNNLDLIQRAYKKGLTPARVRGKLQLYLYSKQHGRTNGAIKAVLYKGYVFIFCTIKKRLITMYELPERYKEDYEYELSLRRVKK